MNWYWKPEEEYNLLRLRATRQASLRRPIIAVYQTKSATRCDSYELQETDFELGFSSVKRTIRSGFLDITSLFANAASLHAVILGDLRLCLEMSRHVLQLCTLFILNLSHRKACLYYPQIRVKILVQAASSETEYRVLYMLATQDLFSSRKTY